MRASIAKYTLGRPRFVLSGLAVAAAFALLPRGLPAGLRPVIAWDIGSVLYLAATWSMMARSDQAAIRGRARRHDVRQWAILGLAVLGLVAAMAALIDLIRAMHQDAGRGGTLDLALVLGSIVSTFAMIHTLFAVHYAHAYYGAPSSLPPLGFPATQAPGYDDFLYFSFVVGMTAQVSDVVVNSSHLRRAVLLQGVVAFFFNSVILALMVNIAAGMIG